MGIDVLLDYLIRENKAALIDLFRAGSSPYFHGISDISRRVSRDPSLGQPVVPVVSEVFAAKNNEESDDGKATGSALVAAMIAVPWILLALACVALLVTALRRRKNARSMQVNSDAVDGSVDEVPSCFDAEVGLAHSASSVSGEDDKGEETESLVKTKGRKGRFKGKNKKGAASSSVTSTSSDACKPVEEEKAEEEGEDTDSTAKKTPRKKMSRAASRKMTSVPDSFDERLKRKMDKEDSQKLSGPDSFDDRLKRKMDKEDSQKLSGPDSFDDRLKRKMDEEGPQKHRHSSRGFGEEEKTEEGAPDDFDERLRRKMGGEDTQRRSKSMLVGANTYGDRTKRKMNREGEKKIIAV